MIKKIVFLFVCLLMVSGCQVEYSLVINDEGIIDEKLISLEKNSFFGNSIEDVKNQLYWSIVMNSDEIIPGSFYKKEEVIGADESGLKYTYSFNFERFSNESEILKNCFNDYTFDLNEDRLYIYANQFLCGDRLGSDSKLNISITANGSLISGNFDRRDGNKYIWNYNNSSFKNIELNLSRDIENDSDDKKEFVYIIIAVLSVLVIVSLVVFVAYIKNKNSNR